MIKIAQISEKFKRVSKNDIIWFFKTVLSDRNLNDEGNITILSAVYSKSKYYHKYYIPSSESKQETKALIIKMTLSNKSQPREYYEFCLVRDRKGEVIYHRSISRIEQISKEIQKLKTQNA